MQDLICIICCEGKFDVLLVDLVIYKLDIIIVDSLMLFNVDVCGYYYLLGECDISFFVMFELVRCYCKGFLQSFDVVFFLMLGEDVVVCLCLLCWFEKEGICLQIMGEFDDGVLLLVFGDVGVGIFVVFMVIVGQICK